MHKLFLASLHLTSTAYFILLPLYKSGSLVENWPKTNATCRRHRIHIIVAYLVPSCFTRSMRIVSVKMKNVFMKKYIKGNVQTALWLHIKWLWRWLYKTEIHNSYLKEDGDFIRQKFTRVCCRILRIIWNINSLQLSKLRLLLRLRLQSPYE